MHVSRTTGHTRDGLAGEVSSRVVDIIVDLVEQSRRHSAGKGEKTTAIDALTELLRKLGLTEVEATNVLWDLWGINIEVARMASAELRTIPRWTDRCLHERKLRGREGRSVAVLHPA
jgi:hypothetical protein